MCKFCAAFSKVANDELPCLVWAAKYATAHSSDGIGLTHSVGHDPSYRDRQTKTV